MSSRPLHFTITMLQKMLKEKVRCQTTLISLMFLCICHCLGTIFHDHSRSLSLSVHFKSQGAIIQSSVFFTGVLELYLWTPFLYVFWAFKFKSQIFMYISAGLKITWKENCEWSIANTVPIPMLIFFVH